MVQVCIVAFCRKKRRRQTVQKKRGRKRESGAGEVSGGKADGRVEL